MVISTNVCMGANRRFIILHPSEKVKVLRVSVRKCAHHRARLIFSHFPILTSNLPGSQTPRLLHTNIDNECPALSIALIKTSINTFSNISPYKFLRLLEGKEGASDGYALFKRWWGYHHYQFH